MPLLVCCPAYPHYPYLLTVFSMPLQRVHWCETVAPTETHAPCRGQLQLNVYRACLDQHRNSHQFLGASDAPAPCAELCTGMPSY